MKKFFTILAVAALFSFQTEAAFIEGLEDVPLLKGLEQTQKDNISFGNAITSSAISTVIQTKNVLKKL